MPIGHARRARDEEGVGRLGAGRVEDPVGHQPNARRAADWTGRGPHHFQSVGDRVDSRKVLGRDRLRLF
jgi:hypothetical protein